MNGISRYLINMFNATFIGLCSVVSHYTCIKLLLRLLCAWIFFVHSRLIVTIAILVRFYSRDRITGGHLHSVLRQHGSRLHVSDRDRKPLTHTSDEMSSITTDSVIWGPLAVITDISIQNNNRMMIHTMISTYIMVE